MTVRDSRTTAVTTICLLAVVSHNFHYVSHLPSPGLLGTAVSLEAILAGFIIGSKLSVSTE